MANRIANRQVICETLLELAETDCDIMVLASDSRGSAAMARLQLQRRGVKQWLTV